MNTGTDLVDWTRAWQAGAAAPSAADLRGQVELDMRRARIALAGPVLVTVLTGGGTLLTALTHKRPGDIALAIGIWAFIAVVWISALWIARGTWRPLAETTDGFLRFSIRRCRSVIAGTRVGATLYTVGLLAILAWQYRFLSMNLRELLTAWPVVLFIAVVTPTVFCTLWIVARRKREELNQLLEAQRQLEELTVE